MSDISTGESIIKLLKKMSRAAEVQSKQLVSKHGVTGTQLTLLRLIATHNELTVGEIAKKLELSNATVTGVVKRMEKNNLVLRTRRAPDKRRVIVTITEKTKSILENQPPIAQQDFLSRFAELEPWEKMMLVSAFERVAHLMGIATEHDNPS